jgi:hypothetical protein
MPDEIEKIAPTEDDIAKLIADSNPDFPLTRDNALAALSPPEGAVFERVAGRDMQGADIIFRYKDGTPFFREVKCIVGGRNSFNRDLQQAVKQLGVPHPIGDVFIQVPSCYPLKEGLQTFFFYRKQKPGALEKYRGICLQVRDETGRILCDAQILEALKEGEQCDR